MGRFMPLCAYRCQSVCVNARNPGANLFVVVQTSHLASGRRAGVITDTGVAPRGDAVFRSWGFRSGDAHYAMRSGIFSYQKLSAALIWLWFARNGIKPRATPPNERSERRLPPRGRFAFAED